MRGYDWLRGKKFHESDWSRREELSMATRKMPPGMSKRQKDAQKRIFRFPKVYYEVADKSVF